MVKVASLSMAVVAGDPWWVDVEELIDGLEFPDIPYLW